MTDPARALISRHDMAISTGLLTRVPVRVNSDLAAARGALSAWAFPLVGVVLGLLCGGLMVCLSGVHVPAPVTAAIGLAALVLLTGGLHEDGLADTADGLGAWARERRLEIMRDSHIGSYGVLALILTMILRWSALSTLIEHGWMIGALVVTLALSRASMTFLWASTPPARSDGFAASLGQPGRKTAIVAVGLATLLAIAILGPTTTLVVSLAVCAASLALARWQAMRALGGQTGDVIGATEQICQCAVLVTLATFATLT